MVEQSNRLRVAAAQTAPILMDKEANLLKIEDYLEQAVKAGADLVVFPECALTGYALADIEEVKEMAEPVPGSSTERLERLCRRLECWAVVGLIESSERTFYNTAVLVGPGGIAARHRKAHLPFQGLDRFASKGREPLRIHETAIGKIGLAICYDIFFPETVRVLTLMGLELLVVPTNWAMGVEFYADHLSQARAVENHVNLVAANRVGEERGFKFYGRSRIVDPNGKILAEAGGGEELITAELDMAEPHRKHIVRIPGEWEIDILRDRRP
ncbi:MAG: carbon-nitrogen hydrolase family protein, partial [Candidatus Bathyarchaeia archaeon]